MVTDPTPVPRPGPPSGGKGGAKGAGLTGRRPLLLLAGGAAVVVVIVALMRRSGSSAGGTTATAPAGTYDSSLSDFENAFEDQLANLQASIAGLQNPPSTGTGHPVGPSSPANGGMPSESGTPVSNGKPPAPFPHPPAAPKPASGPGPSRTLTTIRVAGGDTLSAIAARFGETWQQVWAYNLTAGVRPAATQATLRKRGPNTLVRGEEIYIPRKS